MARVEGCGSARRIPPKKKYVMGREVAVKDASEAPEQPDETPARDAGEVRDKLKNKLLRTSYLDLKTAIYGILNFEEARIAEEADLVHDEELLFLIKKRKAMQLNNVVSQSVRSGKTAEAFKLLADSDEDRAKLNTRTEVKEDKGKGRQIRIIHGTEKV